MGLLHVLEVVATSGDLPASVAFHRNVFGWDVLEGDADAPEGIVLGVPGSESGRLRIVPATAGGKPSDPSPAVWDYGARLLGVYSRDLEATAALIDRHGGAARTPVTYPYGAGSLSEVVARGVDDVWWTVPLAVDGAHRPSPALDNDSQRLHSELHTVVLVVEDHDAAVAFFEGAGMLTLFDGVMTGRDFEQLVGMPSGAELRLAFMVGPEQSPARVEIMSFVGVPAVDRSDDPIGVQRLVFATVDVDTTMQDLLAAGGEPLEHGVLRGPAGVEIQVVRTDV